MKKKKDPFAESVRKLGFYRDGESPGDRGRPISSFKEEHYTDEFIKKLYNEKFHKNHWDMFRPRNLNCASIIGDFYNPESVVDFGCSIGTYLESFLKNGCRVRGFEYAFEECLPQIQKVEGLEEFITFGDVTTPIVLSEKFDLAMSIEVAEHIPESKSDALVDNLCNAALKNIFFTAARPGQGGTGHINLQEKSFWINKFIERGWSLDEEALSFMREEMVPNQHCDGRDQYPMVWLFVYENMVCFRKD